MIQQGPSLVIEADLQGVRRLRVQFEQCDERRAFSLASRAVAAAEALDSAVRSIEKDSPTERGGSRSETRTNRRHDDA